MVGASGIVVAVDGPSGAGKSSASRGLARRLDYRYVDTGAMYRAVAFIASRRGLRATDSAEIAGLARDLRIEFMDDSAGHLCVLADGQDVTSEIRTPEVGQLASAVSALREVREHLVRAQREMGAGGAVVMEGRDIGTVVFPDAAVKFFITASAETRAARRAKELADRGVSRDAAEVEAQQAERDRRDSSRAHAPLRRADDAIVVDTTDLSLEEVVDTMERAVLHRAGLSRSPD